MQRSQSHTLLAGVFVALGVLVYALRDRASVDETIRVVSLSASTATRRTSLEHALTRRTSTRESLAPTPLGGDLVVANDGPQTDHEATVLCGTVVFRDTLEPAGRHDLALWSADATTFVRAETTPNGEFRIAWSAAALPLGRLVHVGIRGPEGVAALHGLAALRQGMTFFVSRPQNVHGRLVGLDACFDPARTAIAAMTVPDRRIWERRLVGRTEVGDDGRFAMLIPGYDCSDAFDVLVSALDGAAGAIARRVPASSLLDPLGASIPLALSHMRVVVEDEHGAPIAGAALQAAALAGATEHAAHEDVLTRDDGSATLLVPASRVELSVFRSGRAVSIEEIDVPPCELTHRVRLARDDTLPLEGEVLLPDGTPVADASATLYPKSTAQTGLAALQAVRTDRAGRFRIARHSERPSHLTIFHRDHGTVEERDLPPSVRFVRVYLEPLGDLRIVVAASALALDSPVGSIQYCLADVERDRTHTGVLELPSVISDVPVGRYNLFVRSAAGEGFGQVHAVVDARDARTVEVELVDGSAWLGAVVRADGSPVEGARVRLIDPTWPEELLSWWGATTTDAHGQFFLVAGAATRAVLEVDGPVAEPTRSSASAGKRATIVVR
ncbi:MAG: hypothetical protein ACKVWV_10215 [Planctomycetota bacterium]